MANILSFKICLCSHIIWILSGSFLLHPSQGLAFLRHWNEANSSKLLISGYIPGNNSCIKWCMSGSQTTVKWTHSSSVETSSTLIYGCEGTMDLPSQRDIFLIAKTFYSILLLSLPPPHPPKKEKPLIFDTWIWKKGINFSSV